MYELCICMNMLAHTAILEVPLTFENTAECS